MFLNKVILAVLLSFSMLAITPSAMAAGKIENKSPEQTSQDVKDTVAIANEALQALKDGTIDKDSMMAMFKTVKQKAKTIESAVTYMIRERALGRLKKARSAYKKDDLEKAIDKMEQTVKLFDELDHKYHNF